MEGPPAFRNDARMADSRRESGVSGAEVPRSSGPEVSLGERLAGETHGQPTVAHLSVAEGRLTAHQGVGETSGPFETSSGPF